MNKKPKFKKGDKIEIVRYGSIMWMTKLMFDQIQQMERNPKLEPTHLLGKGNWGNNDSLVYIIDTNPELVGQKAVVDEVTITQGKPQYSLNGVNKHAWYDEEQLKLTR